MKITNCNKINRDINVLLIVTLCSYQCAIFKKSPSKILAYEGVEKIIPTDLLGNSDYGSAVDIYDSIAVVGVKDGIINGKQSGAVYVFFRNHPGPNLWWAVDTLYPPNANDGDLFGSAVSIFGNDIIVGAPGDDDGTAAGPGLLNESGAAYIFHYNKDTGWSFTKKLKADDANAGNQFGKAVAICKNEAIVSAVPLNPGQSGRIYYYKLENKWILKQKLYGRDEANLKYFGHSVAMNSKYIAGSAIAPDNITSISTGVVYLFKRSPNDPDHEWDSYPQILQSETPFTPDNFGRAIDMSDKWLVVGADATDYKTPNSIVKQNGCIYLFNPDGSGRRKIIFTVGQKAHLGASVGISDQIIAGSRFKEKSYIIYPFRAIQIKEISSPEPAGYQGGFGTAVSIFDTTAVIGAPTARLGGNSGIAYLYTENKTKRKWAYTAQLVPFQNKSGGIYTYSSLAVNGDWIIVGSRDDKTNGPGSGTAYLYHKNAGGNGKWGLVSRLSLKETFTPPDRSIQYHFGADVDISDEYVLIGSPVTVGPDVAQNTGYLYLFKINDLNFSFGDQFEKLSPPLSGSNNINYLFGTSVAMDGNTIVVGAPQYNYNIDKSHVFRGAAFIYQKNALGGWSPPVILYGDNLSSCENCANFQFGSNVAIHGDNIIVGAEGNSSTFSKCGIVVFSKVDGLWRKQISLTEEYSTGLGSAVAIGDYFAAAGNRVQNKVYVFQKSVSKEWNPEPKILTESGSEYFGQSVDISNDTLLIGAKDKAFLYKLYNNGTWNKIGELSGFPTAFDPNFAEENFGYSVVMKSGIITISANWAKLTDNSYKYIIPVDGAAYIFNLTPKKR